MNYKVGFFVILVVFVATSVTASMLFDRTITNYLLSSQLIEPMEQEYRFLDPKYYHNVEIPPPLSYERHVRDIGDFAMWKDSLMDPNLLIEHNQHPESTDPEAVSPGLEKLFLGEIIVYHAAPPDRSNGKAVLVIPGSGDGAAREIMGIMTRHEPYHDKIGLRLAEAGYDAYTLELDGWGERQKDVGSTCPNSGIANNCEYFAFQEKLARYGLSLMSMHEKEVATVLSYVSSKHDWIAISGLSGGVPRALSVALANPDTINATVLASGINIVHGWPMFVTAGPYIATEYNVEDIDRVRALAPMPLYMSYGSLEAGPPGYAATSGDVQRTVQTAYDLHGAAGTFRYVVHDGAHAYDVDSVIEFLDSN